MIFPGHFTDENDPRIGELCARMGAFYQNTPEYTAFRNANEMPHQWSYIRAAILAVLEKKPMCRVLEFGAGKSGFAHFVKDIGGRIHYTAQDVTRINEAHLRSVADAMHFGSIAELEGEFDIIFSTFVFEHVTDPRNTLERLLLLLANGGKIFLFCPCYDAPFYLSHSVDHYSVARRLEIAVLLALARLRTLFTGKPLFLIHADPAMFHLTWTRDRDAIHWASLWDLRAFFRGRGVVRMLKIPSHGLKDWIVKNLLQINVEIQRVK